MRKPWHQPVLLLGILAVFVVFAVPQAQAIPAFARKYGTSCTTCHDDFPHLNDFGKAFKDAGFKFPKDDESFIKVPPTMLGAPAQKDLWPHTVWPGVIDGLPPIGLRMNNYFQVVGRNRGRFQSLPTAAILPGDGTPSIPGFIPRTDFQTGLFSIFTAGNFGGDIAFWVDDDISVGGENGAGGLGDAYLRFVNVSRFLHLPKDSLHLRIGQFELELPFSQARSWNISPWDIYEQNNAGVEGAQNVANNFTIGDGARGVEISGGHHYGGYFYSIALVNQVTGTQPVDVGTLGVPSATGGNSGGLGFSSDANFKDVYARLAYRFNLERDAESRHAVQAAGPMGPRNHTFLTLGTLYFYGRSVERFVGQDSTGTPVVLTARQPFYRVGGDFEFNYRNFDLFGVFMYGRDHNLLPIDATGALIPLPIADTSLPPVPVGFVRGTPATFSGGFIQADYMPLPWIMLIMRYDGVNSFADFTNGGLATVDSVTSSTTVPGAGVPFIGQVRQTRNRFTPGVQFLIRSNIKATFEYQIRPRQQIAEGVNPVTQLPVVITPFRTNTATFGLDFVY